MDRTCLIAMQLLFKRSDLPQKFLYESRDKACLVSTGSNGLSYFVVAGQSAMNVI